MTLQKNKCRLCGDKEERIDNNKDNNNCNNNNNNNNTHGSPNLGQKTKPYNKQKKKKWEFEK